MTQSPIATAADYADALMTARRARTWLFTLLLLMILGQLAVFFVARYTNVIISTTSTSQPAVNPLWGGVLHYLIGITDFLGIALAIVLSMVLLLIINIMLVGRLIGVSRVVSAFIWGLVLLVLLFPWQAFVNYAQIPAPPGILYTWAELFDHAKFGDGPMTFLIVKWARFVAFPLIAVLILLLIQTRSTRGLRLALGESEMEAPSAPAVM